MTFGEAFKKERKQAGVSQGKISKSMGWSSPQFVSNWERGLSYPSQESLKTICDKFSMDYDKMVSIILKEKTQALRDAWKPKHASKEA